MSPRHALVLASLVALSAPPLAHAQSERPWQRLFGARTPAKTAPDDGRRRAEVGVELAWLADPVTFPYYLEAHVDGSALEVRGYVPNRQVRDHALKLARLHSPLTVTDAMKEHPSLLVRPSAMSQQQLQRSAASVLREALPKQYQALQVQAADDGSVTVRGTVKTPEDRLAVSHSLRRLHGCTSVQNLTKASAEPEPRPVAATPASKSNDPAKDAKAPKTWFGTPTVKKDAKPAEKEKPAATAQKKPAPPVPPRQTSEPPPVVQAPPVVDGPKITEAPKVAAAPKQQEPPPVIEGPKIAPLPPESKQEPTPTEAVPPPAPRDPPKAATPGERATLAALWQRLILEKCNGARDAKVEFKSATELVVELTVRSDEQISTFAGIVLNLPELEAYRERIDLQFKVEP